MIDIIWIFIACDALWCSVQQMDFRCVCVCSYLFLCWWHHVGKSNCGKNVEKSMSYTYCDNTTPRQQARGEFVDTCRYAYILVSTRQGEHLQRYSWTAACHLQSIVAHAVMGSVSGAEIFLIQMAFSSWWFSQWDNQERLRWILDDTFATSQHINKP